MGLVAGLQELGRGYGSKARYEEAEKSTGLRGTGGRYALCGSHRSPVRPIDLSKAAGTCPPVAVRAALPGLAGRITTTSPMASVIRDEFWTVQRMFNARRREGGFSPDAVLV